MMTTTVAGNSSDRCAHKMHTDRVAIPTERAPLQPNIRYILAKRQLKLVALSCCWDGGRSADRVRHTNIIGLFNCAQASNRGFTWIISFRILPTRYLFMQISAQPDCVHHPRSLLLLRSFIHTQSQCLQRPLRKPRTTLILVTPYGYVLSNF